MDATEHDDYRMAHRLCEIPGIIREVERREALQTIASDADWREWQDSLIKHGVAGCDTRGVLVYLG